MLDKDFDITAIDSLMNHDGKSDEELASLICGLGLSFSPEFFKEIYKCISAEAITPSYELLYFFDAIFLASKNDTKNIKISEISAEDKEVNLSFIDLCRKASYLGKEAPISLSDILKISSEYLATLDIKAPSTVGKGENLAIYNERGKKLISIGLDEKKPLRYGYASENENPFEDKKEYLPEGTDIFIVSAEDENYLRLAESEEFYALNTACEKIDKNGLLYALLGTCCGAEINLHGALPSLVSAFVGKSIVMVPSERSDAFISLAESYEAVFVKIATALDIPVMRIVNADEEISIRSGFLRRLYCFEQKISVKIPSGQITPTKYKKLHSSLSCELEEAIEVSSHIVSARYTEELSFGVGMNAVLDALFALLSKGANRRKAGISIRLGVRRENLGGGMGALLGAYRAIMELCLPEINSEVFFSDEDYLICTAFARKEEFSSFTENHEKDTQIYLLSFGRSDSSLPRYMPKFDELRNMCDYLFEALSVGAVISAHAINGAISDTAESYSISSDTVAQGFIVEANSDTKINAPLIGVVKYENIQNNDTEETV